jgi:hypothetical protein
MPGWTGLARQAGYDSIAAAIRDAEYDNDLLRLTSAH